MAVYPYVCPKCGHEMEKEIPMKDYDKEKNNQTCDECGEKAERSFKTGTLITHYACDGFYQTSYGKGHFD